MRRGIRQIVIALCVLAVLVAGNSHLLLVQGAGWAGMLVQYSQESGSMTVGAQRTFSGQDPCSICKSVMAALDERPAEIATSAPPPEFRPLMLSGAVLFYPPRAHVASVRMADSAAPPNPTYRPPNLPS